MEVKTSDTVVIQELQLSEMELDNLRWCENLVVSKETTMEEIIEYYNKLSRTRSPSNEIICRIIVLGAENE